MSGIHDKEALINLLAAGFSHRYHTPLIDFVLEEWCPEIVSSFSLSHTRLQSPPCCCPVDSCMAPSLTPFGCQKVKLVFTADSPSSMASCCPIKSLWVTRCAHLCIQLSLTEISVNEVSASEFGYLLMKELASGLVMPSVQRLCLSGLLPWADWSVALWFKLFQRFPRVQHLSLHLGLTNSFARQLTKAFVFLQNVPNSQLQKVSLTLHHAISLQVAWDLFKVIIELPSLIRFNLVWHSNGGVLLSSANRLVKYLSHEAYQCDHNHHRLPKKLFFSPLTPKEEIMLLSSSIETTILSPATESLIAGWRFTTLSKSLLESLERFASVSKLCWLHFRLSEPLDNVELTSVYVDQFIRMLTQAKDTLHTLRLDRYITELLVNQVGPNRLANVLKQLRGLRVLKLLGSDAIGSRLWPIFTKAFSQRSLSFPIIFKLDDNELTEATVKHLFTLLECSQSLSLAHCFRHAQIFLKFLDLIRRHAHRRTRRQGNSNRKQQRVPPTLLLEGPVDLFLNWNSLTAKCFTELTRLMLTSGSLLSHLCKLSLRGCVLLGNNNNTLFASQVDGYESLPSSKFAHQVAEDTLNLLLCISKGKLELRELNLSTCELGFEAIERLAHGVSSLSLFEQGFKHLCLAKNGLSSADVLLLETQYSHLGFMRFR